MESKDLLTLCQQHGIDVKNQLSSIDPEVRDQVVQLVKRGPATAAAAPQRPPVLTPTHKVPVLDKKIKTIQSAQPKQAPPEAVHAKTVSPAPPAPAPQA